MKKVLIWDISFNLANIGGPAGYLYNLHEYLKEHPNPQITFLSDLYEKQETTEKVSGQGRSFLKNIVRNNALTKKCLDLYNMLWRSYKSSRDQLPQNVNLNNYDFIHFHKVSDITNKIELLKDYRGKTILTSHCPCPMTDEILAQKPRWYRIFRPIMIYLEVNAMHRADFLMFPCKDAREPYEKEPKMKKAFHSMEHKFFYVPTAILDIPIDKEKMQKLSDFRIPEGSFVITYFGRHNHIKGYDILKELGSFLLDKYPNLYFLCAGKGNIEPLNHPRWIELGFINNTHELLAQSDLYVLPNRETYFDLVVLEILRAGVNLMLSDTGGNKYFKDFVKEYECGMQFFSTNDIKGLITLVEQNIQRKYDFPHEHLMRGLSNRKYWEDNFTLDKYVKRYTQELDAL